MWNNQGGIFLLNQCFHEIYLEDSSLCNEIRGFYYLLMIFNILWRENLVSPYDTYTIHCCLSMWLWG